MKDRIKKTGTGKFQRIAKQSLKRTAFFSFIIAILSIPVIVASRKNAMPKLAQSNADASSIRIENEENKDISPMEYLAQD